MNQSMDDTIGRKGIVKKAEFVSLLAESLEDLGYHETLASLERESNVFKRSSIHQLIVDERWEECVAALRSIEPVPEDRVLKEATFVLLEQKYLKLIGEGKEYEACDMLQKEITPLDINVHRRHQLCMCLLDGDAINRKSTREVISVLKNLLPPGILIPQGRLVELMEQFLDSQRRSCVFHNSNEGFSLVVDHDCGRSHVPSRALQVVREHRGGVSCVRFAHNGTLLASSSKDRSAIIWDVGLEGQLLLKHTLVGHNEPVCCVSWSPDDKQLLTCGEDEVVRRWDAVSGECLRVYSVGNVNRGMMTCVWSPSGESIFAILATGTIRMFALDSNAYAYDSWYKRSLKKSDLQITSDAMSMISMRDDKTISVFHRESKDESLIVEEDKIVSFVLSPDNRFLLVTLRDRGVRLWTLEGGRTRAVAEYADKRASRACFGGINDAFVASASTDSCVRIWHRDTGELLHTLRGHERSVNCTTWNPMQPQMLASGGDDGTIRVWGT